jgi:hypothetical protein
MSYEDGIDVAAVDAVVADVHETDAATDLGDLIGHGATRRRVSR